MTKILGITTDNASNNNTFLEEVSHELAEKNIELDNVNQHEAASNAISKLLEYYDKTDTSIYTISLVLEP
uniref:Uncharacterized protein n=1 Tax=Rhizophagus irregularis (strain DAOM 181602 / DAOM 197198 / MUCL 43194) TaxID=747089 RepID=U9TAU4_RHIID